MPGRWSLPGHGHSRNAPPTRPARSALPPFRRQGAAKDPVPFTVIALLRDQGFKRALHFAYLPAGAELGVQDQPRIVIKRREIGGGKSAVAGRAGLAADRQT